MVEPVLRLRLDRADRVAAAYEALNRRDVDSFCSIHDPQVITVDPALGNPVGTAAVLADHHSFAIALSDLHYEVERVIDAAPHTVVQLRVQGTHDGPWGRHQPTGRRINIPVCEVCDWSDERITVRRRYWDRQAALIQLGLH